MPAESASTRDMRGLRRTRGDGGVDAAVAELARGQHGVVSRGQLIELGLGEDAIERRLGLGRLHRLQRGVYAVGHRAVSRHGHWLAAVLASGPEAALSHWSAAALWMIRPNSRELIDVTVPHRSRSSRQIRRHVSKVPADERTVGAGVPVTAVPRTILDLAATGTADTVEAMLHEAEFRRLRDRLSLPDLIARYPGRRGVHRVEQAVERLEEQPRGRRRSLLEERFAAFLHRHHLPGPRFNDWVRLAGKYVQVDCHWPGAGQIVELDGWQGHGTKSAFRADRARDRALHVAGYSVTRLTWAQLDDEPERSRRTCGRC